MARILVVDDEPLNRQLLRAYFEGSGHTLMEAASGEEALALAAEAPADLVLLDVVMPGMGGFATCRRFKETSAPGYLPVVLITARADRESRVAGLQVGADDFLTKPLDRQELLVRVGNLLALRTKEQELEARSIELAELHRFKDEMIELLVHDLKNPMAVILMNLEHALQDRGVDPDTHEALDDCLSAGQRMNRLIGNMLDLTRMEAGRVSLRRAGTNLRDVVNGVVEPRAAMARRRDVVIDVDVPPDAVADIDRDLVARLLENLADNSLRHAPSDGRIRIWATRHDDMIELRIGNSGAAVPPGSRMVVFEKFGQGGTGHGRMNLGLGLYFCRLVAETHGGRIWIEETRDLPAVFVVSLPPHQSAR